MNHGTPKFGVEMEAGRNVFAKLEQLSQASQRIVKTSALRSHSLGSSDKLISSVPGLTIRGLVQLTITPLTFK